MGVCVTVKSLAESVSTVKTPEDSRHRILVEILRLMPLYRDIFGLVAWESAFRGALAEEDDDSEVGQILYEVFDFGTFNMYGAFDADGTAQEFERVSAWLRQGGVPVLQPQGIADW